MKLPPFIFTEITDSRGVPTIAVSAELDGAKIEAKVPAGTSTGSKEAVAIPVTQALAQTKELNDYLAQTSFDSLLEFDQALLHKDGTPDKSNLGGNTILALSMLFCRLSARSAGLELYQWLRQAIGGEVSKRNLTIPMMVMIEGGQHAQSGTLIQELLINGSITDGTKVWRQIDTGDPMGMEGGFDMTFPVKEKSDRLALSKLHHAITSTAVPMTISVDMAANNIPEGYRYDVAEVVSLAKDFALQSIEDPFLEDDWDNWTRLCLELKGHRLATEVIGDDLTVTNPARLSTAIEKKALTGVIIKPNQVGTVSETLEFTKMAKEHGLVTIVSHRSGETDDTFIADLAVAIDADYLKAGAPSKRERLVKYERLALITS